MTTTTPQQGLQDNKRLTSTRVLRPPGGESSDIFGVGKTYSSPPWRVSGDDTAKQNTPPQQTTTTNESYNRRHNRRGQFNPITGEPYDYATPSPAKQTTVNKTEDQAVPQQIGDQTSDKQTETNDQAKEMNEEKKEKKPEERQAAGGKAQAVHTSSRVLNPPGGPTTRLW